MIFERFYRIENQVHTIKGTGLGLHLVKVAVEKHHNGRVFVHSKLNEGSTFGFWLPIEKADIKEKKKNKVQTPQDYIKQGIDDFKVEKIEDYSKKQDFNAQTLGIEINKQEEEKEIETTPEPEQKLVFNEINNPIKEDEDNNIQKSKEDEWEITFEVRD